MKNNMIDKIREEYVEMEWEIDTAISLKQHTYSVSKTKTENNHITTKLGTWDNNNCFS